MYRWKKLFLQAGTNSGKLKVESLIFGWHKEVKKGHGLLEHLTIKSVFSFQINSDINFWLD